MICCRALGNTQILCPLASPAVSITPFPQALCSPFLSLGPLFPVLSFLFHCITHPHTILLQTLHSSGCTPGPKAAMLTALVKCWHIVKSPCGDLLFGEECGAERATVFRPPQDCSYCCVSICEYNGDTSLHVTEILWNPVWLCEPVSSCVSLWVCMIVSVSLYVVCCLHVYLCECVTKSM